MALDSEPGAPDPWIEKASPTYPVLIDREHRIAELYNLVNVPQAVWIDEEGRIVRPPETAGSFDIMNKREPGATTLSEEILERSKQTRLYYLAAIKDWVENGAASKFAMTEAEVRAHMTPPDDSVLAAHTHFRLGQYLLANGRSDEATQHLDRAKGLHPDSWAMWRQSSSKLENGIAAGPEFAARVAERREANKAYYADIDMPGMPG